MNNNECPRVLIISDATWADENNIGNTFSNLFEGWPKDKAVSSSKREGLPVNVMEAMATGLPLVVSNCRGNRDLVKNDVSGYVIDLDDVDDFVDAIYKIYSDEALYNKFSKASLDLIRKYSLENVSIDMREIYTQSLMEGK